MKTQITECFLNILSPDKHNVSLILVLCLLCVNTYANTILVHGDSLSAGYGLQQEEAWPTRLNQKLQDQGFDNYTVVNSSISGETTAGGLKRFKALIDNYQPAIVILELGANDGLRGQSLKAMRTNLGKMITLAKQSGSQVILAGIHIPPNYGSRYSEAFYQSFERLKNAHNISLIPFLLEGVATDDSLMQQDGLHPNNRAQPRITETVWKTLKPLLQPPE